MKTTFSLKSRHFRLHHTVTQKNSTFTFHAHDEYEILFFLSGEVQYYIENESFSLIPGDVLVIPPRTFHRLVTVDETICYNRMILSLSLEYCKKLLSTVPESFVFQGVQTFYVPLGKEIDSVVKMLEDLLSFDDSPAALLARDATVTLILLHLDRWFEKNPRKSESESKISQILRYLDANFTRNINLDQLADRFFISKYHLLRQFKNYTNCTLHRYVLSKRILLAKALLRDGVSPSESAAQCGFSSYTGFYQAFLAQTGKSPSDFLKHEQDLEKS